MLKEYTYSFTNILNGVSSVGNVNAHNTEELSDLIYPFAFTILSVRRASKGLIG